MRTARSGAPALGRAGALFGAWVILSTVLAAGPAAALPTPVMECTAYGTVTLREATHEENPGHIRFPRTWWEIEGEGECYGGGKGPWHVELSGTGSHLWHMLGGCSGDPLLESWRLNTIVELESSHPFGPERTREQTWRAPQETTTTFPVATPFEIEEADEPAGAGALFTKLFVQCPGSPPTAEQGGEPWQATFVWTMLA